MTWLRPWWLLALIPLAGLLWSIWRSRPKADAGPWVRLVDPHLLPYLLVGNPHPLPRWPVYLLGLGWLILVIALAGPVWRKLPQPVFALAERTLILIDLSPSMNASDIAPSRLGRARFETLDLLRAGQGQVGLLAFGPEPFVVSPMTTDAKTILPQVTLLSSDLIPFPGPRRTDRALSEARTLLERSPGGAAQVVLISDGVGEFAGALAEARRLSAAGHRLSVLGVGGAEGVAGTLARGDFASGPDGTLALTPFERESLQALARAGQGIYVESVPGDSDTQALLAATPRPNQALLSAALQSDQWHEEGPWLILLLLPLAALAFRRGWLTQARRSSQPLFVLLLFFSSAWLWPAPESEAFDWKALWLRPEQQAAHALAADQLVDAASLTDPRWRAAARYRAGDLEGALAELAGLEGPEIDYNRGVALARLGRFAEAAALFEQTLKQDPEHADARHNLELMRRLLAQPAEANPEAAPMAPDPDRPFPPGGIGGPPSRDLASHPGSARQSQSDEDEAGQGSTDAGPRPGQAPGLAQAQSGGESADQDASAQAHPGGSGPFGLTEFARGQGQGIQDDSGTSRSEHADLGSTQASAGAWSISRHSGDRQDVWAEGSWGADAEQAQSMEIRLRAIPDDPAGLLRQRFFLQHLRRKEEGG